VSKPQMITTKEFAKMHKVALGTAQRWVRQGLVPHELRETDGAKMVRESDAKKFTPPKRGRKPKAE